MPEIRFKRIDTSSADIPLPSYATEDSSGMDIRSSESFELQPGERRLISTGLAIEIPAGFEGQVRPRSGLAIKHGVTCLNTPGTIDADYRGEVKVILINLGHQAVTFDRGDRIAQLVIARYERCEVSEADALVETARGEGGFGHSGIR